MPRQLAGTDQVHIAEAAGVVIADDRKIAHLEDDVVVLVAGAGLMGEFAEHLPVFTGVDRKQRADDEASAHAEMHSQRLSVVQLGQQIFRPAAQMLHAPALEALGKIGWQRKAQIRPALLDPREGRPFEHRHEAKTDGFDFGKLRHGATIARRCKTR